MEYKKINRGEFLELMHQANSERAAKAAATRRVRQWLGCLYALEDPRQPEALSRPDDSVDFPERLHGLPDLRGSEPQ
jgi:hypothetical protein